MPSAAGLTANLETPLRSTWRLLLDAAPTFMQEACLVELEYHNL